MTCRVLRTRAVLLTGLWTAVVLGLGGCSTRHVPRGGPGIQITQSWGRVQFIKDGVPVGSDLTGATVEVPEAHRYARAHRIKSRVARVFMPMAAAFFMSSRVADLRGHDGLGLGLAVGGILSAMTGVSLLVSSDADMLDAVNLYNGAQRGNP